MYHQRHHHTPWLKVTSILFRKEKQRNARPRFVTRNDAVLTAKRSSAHRSVLAFVGYLVTFMINRMMARRADHLRLVDQRLNDFYGPLYVATIAGNIAYKSLLSKQGKTQCHPFATKT